MSTQLRTTASDLWLCVFVISALVQHGVQGQDGQSFNDSSPTISQFLQQKSNNAVYIAGNATDNERTCGALANLQCLSALSTLACTNVPTSDLECTGTPRNNNTVCGVSNCSSILLSYAYSSIRFPGLPVQQTGSSPGLINALDPLDLVSRDVCVHQPLDAKVFKNIVPTNGTNTTFLDWAYFGTARGVMREYPFKVGQQSPADARSVTGSGGDIQCSDGYDPRRRNWFNGAASQSKTLVVLIDLGSTASSLGSFLLSSFSLTPLDMIKNTTSRLLDTLRAFDSVSVYTFQGSSIEVLADRFQVTSYNIPRTTEEGVNNLLAALDQLSASRDTRARSNLVDVLNQIVTQFETPPEGSPPSDCEKEMVVFTDGGSLANFDPAVAANITLAANMSLFVFSVGDAGRTQNDGLLQNLTCQASGVWGRLNNYQDPLLSMYPYFNYLAFKSPYKSGSATYRTLPYIDFSIASLVVTHAKPVYDPAGNLVGVSGDDFPTAFGFASKYPLNTIIATLGNLSESCTVVQPTFCDLQRIRAAFTSDQYECPTPSGQSSCALPTITCPTTVPTGSVVLKNPAVISNIVPLTCCSSCLVESPQNTTGPNFAGVDPTASPGNLSIIPGPSPVPTQKKNKKRVVIIVVVVVIVALVLIVVIFCLGLCGYRRFKRKAAARQAANVASQSPKDPANGLPLPPPPDDQ